MPKMAEIEELLNVNPVSFYLFCLCDPRSFQECTEISYVDFDIKNNTIILWTESLVSVTV
jgi:hypothetical protein